MTSPPITAKVEIHLADWTDITAYVLNTDQIQTTRGRANEANRVDPSTCQFRLDNTDGRFSPRNPNSPYYGLIGRNTPLRVSLGTINYAAAGFTDLVAKTTQTAPSIDSPSATARLFCAWANPTPSGSYTYPGGMTGTSVWTDARSTMGSAHEALVAGGPTGTRTATAGVASKYLSASVLLTGSTTVQETETDVDGFLATDAGTQVGWWIVLFTYWAWDDEDAVIPSFPVSDEGGWILAADTGTANPADADAAYFRMKAWIKQVKVAGVHQIQIGGPDTSLSIMRVVSGVTDWSPRFSGDVVAWPQTWSIPTDVRVSVQAAGIMRRLGQGASELQSALARRVPTKTPPRGQFAAGQGVVAYWPMEDAATAHAFASGLSNGTPMSGNAPTLVEPVAQEGPPGSKNLPLWHQDGSMFGTVPSVVTYGSNPTITKALGVPWRVDWMFFMPTAPGSGREMISVETSSSDLARWTMLCGPTDVNITVEDDGGATVQVDALGALPANFYGNWIRCKLRVNQSGSTVSVIANIVAMDGTVMGSWSYNVTGTHSAGRPKKAGLVINSADERSLGHITVTQDAAVSMDPFAGAYNGFTGETAAARVERLCAEEGLLCSIIGDPESIAAGKSPVTQAMGPQRQLALLDLLQECADADQGILYEPREFTGLVFHTRRSLYNRAAILQLDYRFDGFGSAPEPVDDDQLTRNDVTASRDGGSSARTTLDTGPLSTQPPPDGVGRYDEEFTVNIANDDGLPNAAGWRLHLGTVDEARYPLIDLNLISYGFVGRPSLAAATAIDVGDRLTVDNLPAWMPPGQVSLLAQGFTETFDSHTRRIVVNCTPESPYRVMTWESAISGTGWKWDTAGSELASSATTTATSLSVATTVGPVWTDVDAEDGFDIVIGGERMTVTDVAGTTSPQTFTVTRSINGVVKSHSTGAAVRLFKTPIWAL